MRTRPNGRISCTSTTAIRGMTTTASGCWTDVCPGCLATPGLCLTASARRHCDARARAAVTEPVRLNDGSIFGTLCTLSFHARHDLNEHDLALVRIVAQLASELLEKDHERTRREEQIRARIQGLLDGDELRMVWQPIVGISDKRIVGVESLSRFPAERGLGPADWFDEAAEVGLADTLESRAVENALAALEHLPEHCFVAFNISGKALLRSGVASTLRGVALNRVVLEITEHDVIDGLGEPTRALAPLRRQGLRLAVDDAGASHASLRHILQLRPNLIKLDMNLVLDIDQDITRRSLAASLVQFARDIGSLLIAEGVEMEGELAVLREMGVETVQGFHLHPPMELDGLLRLVQSGA